MTGIILSGADYNQIRESYFGYFIVYFCTYYAMTILFKLGFSLIGNIYKLIRHRQVYWWQSIKYALSHTAIASVTFALIAVIVAVVGR